MTTRAQLVARQQARWDAAAAAHDAALGAALDGAVVDAAIAALCAQLDARLLCASAKPSVLGLNVISIVTETQIDLRGVFDAHEGFLRFATQVIGVDKYADANASAQTWQMQCQRVYAAHPLVVRATARIQHAFPDMTVQVNLHWNEIPPSVGPELRVVLAVQLPLPRMWER